MGFLELAVWRDSDVDIRRRVANLIWARPLRIRRWHPLSPPERRAAEAFRRDTENARPAPERDLDLRLLTRERLLELRETAKRRGYPGRAWRDGADYLINESAFIWLSVGVEAADDVLVCNLVVSQTEFDDYERKGTAHPVGTSTRRHTLHVHRSDLRHLHRASPAELRHIYFRLQAALPLDRDEVEPW